MTTRNVGRFARIRQTPQEAQPNVLAGAFRQGNRDDRRRGQTRKKTSTARQALHPQGKEPGADETLAELKERYRLVHSDLCNLVAEYHLRPSLALGCICFALIGCPVGIWFSKSDYLSAFITCFLPVVVIYYPLLLAGINMGKSGTMPPSVSIWAANIVMGCAALVLFRQLQRH